jgi:hypothetical protein
MTHIVFTLMVFCAYPPGIPEAVAEKMTTAETQVALCKAMSPRPIARRQHIKPISTAIVHGAHASRIKEQLG